jgi:hypothetical protein
LATDRKEPFGVVVAFDRPVTHRTYRVRSRYVYVTRFAFVRLVHSTTRFDLGTVHTIESARAGFTPADVQKHGRQVLSGVSDFRVTGLVGDFRPFMKRCAWTHKQVHDTLTNQSFTMFFQRERHFRSRL